MDMDVYGVSVRPRPNVTDRKDSGMKTNILDYMINKYDRISILRILYLFTLMKNDI